MSADDMRGVRTETASSDASPVKRSGSRFRFRGAFVGFAAVLIALAGAYWISLPATSEETEDAYVDVDFTYVAPRVRGFISEIAAGHNSSVSKGDVLVRIEPEEFEAKLATAEADVASARAGVAAARSALSANDQQNKLARFEIDAANSALLSAQADAKQADADWKRYARLVETNAVSRSAEERYHTTAITAQQAVQQARTQLAVARQQVVVIQAQHTVEEANLQKAAAQLDQAQAAKDLAEQDLHHTVITAPISGIVADRKANVGDYVQPGSRLLTIVPVTESYVTAYFKETQIARMRPGLSATVEVDALGGAELHGVVDSLAPGSGSQFSLLPFEPGTGNFTKIVQRVPVRIHLDKGQAGLDKIRPGLSATVRVHLDSASETTTPREKTSKKSDTPSS